MVVGWGAGDRGRVAPARSPSPRAPGVAAPPSPPPPPTHTHLDGQQRVGHHRGSHLGQGREGKHLQGRGAGGRPAAAPGRRRGAGAGALHPPGRRARPHGPGEPFFLSFLLLLCERSFPPPTRPSPAHPPTVPLTRPPTHPPPCPLTHPPPHPPTPLPAPSPPTLTPPGGGGRRDLRGCSLAPRTPPRAARCSRSGPTPPQGTCCAPTKRRWTGGSSARALPPCLPACLPGWLAWLAG